MLLYCSYNCCADWRPHLAQIVQPVADVDGDAGAAGRGRLCLVQDARPHGPVPIKLLAGSDARFLQAHLFVETRQHISGFVCYRECICNARQHTTSQVLSGILPDGVSDVGWTQRQRGLHLQAVF